MKKLLIWVFGIFLFFSGCDNKLEDNMVENNNIIGAVIPLTGEVATYGKSLQKGFDLYLQENSNIKIKYFDTKGDAKYAVSAIKKLNSENISFALGDATSSSTLAMSPIANKNNIILFTPIATSDKLEKAGKFIFKNAPKNEKQANRAYNFLVKEKSYKNIGVIYKNSSYSTNLAKVFMEMIKKDNINICEINYNETSNFRISIEKLRKCDVDSVFMPSNYEDTGRFLKQLKENKLDITVVGTDGAYSEKLIELAKGSTDNFYLTMMEVDKANPMYHKFVTNYKKKYNSEPDIFTAYGYEAISILSKAIEKSESSDSDNVRTVLLNNSFESMTGHLSFDKTGELNRSYGILKILNNKFIEYKEK
jgi:branched-chain amino acid transport system substrate-binding protein